MRFTVYLCAALAALTADMTVEAMNLEQVTKVTGFDPTKYNWIEKPPGSGHYVKKDQPKMEPKPLSRVKQLIKENEERIAANAAANAKTQKQYNKMASNAAAGQAKRAEKAAAAAAAAGEDD